MSLMSQNFYEQKHNFTSQQINPLAHRLNRIDFTCRKTQANTNFHKKLILTHRIDGDQRQSTNEKRFITTGFGKDKSARRPLSQLREIESINLREMIGEKAKQVKMEKQENKIKLAKKNQEFFRKRLQTKNKVDQHKIQAKQKIQTFFINKAKIVRQPKQNKASFTLNHYRMDQKELDEFQKRLVVMEKLKQLITEKYLFKKQSRSIEQRRDKKIRFNQDDHNLM